MRPKPLKKKSAEQATPALEVWGLTGGIASGKSTVARLFEKEHGIPVIDADEVNRELSAPGGAAHAAIVARFGTADRARLRELVFMDPAARRDLEAILHPLIREESERRIAGLAAQGTRRVLYEATLLVETGRYRDFAGLIVVESPRAARIARLTARDGLTREQSERVLAAQASDEDRRRAATTVIENSGSLEELRQKVAALVSARGW